MATFLILVCSVVAMGFFGAGVLPGVLQPVAVLVCIGCILSHRNLPRHHDWLAFFAVALVAMVVFTAVPFPAPLDRAMGKITSQQNEVVRGTVSEAAQIGLVEPGEPHFSISRNRAGTLRIALLLVAGFAAACLTSRLPSLWKRRYLVFLALFGTVMAVAGYYSQRIFPQGRSLWWLFPVPFGSPVGCFINRNHFGGFVAMLCPVTAALLMDGLSRRKYLEVLLWSLSFGVMSLAVIMSLSRGAWMAYAVAGIVMIGLLMRRRRYAAGLGLITIIAVAALAVVVPARRELGDRVRLMTDSPDNFSLQFRLSTWRDSLRIFPDHPLLGIGANGLRTILPQYRRGTTGGEADFAENEYVQVPVEFGLCGLALILPMCACVAIRWRRNNAAGAISPTVGYAVSGALAVVMTHSFVDFAIRVPLYFVAFCSIVGLVTGAAGYRDDVTETGAGMSARKLPGSHAAIPLVGLMIVLIVSLLGRAPYNLDSYSYLSDAGPKDLMRALEWSPTSWRAWYGLGNAAAALGSPENTVFGERCLVRATEYDPKSYMLWRDLATLRLSMNDRAGAMEAYKRVKSLRTWVKIPELD